MISLLVTFITSFAVSIFIVRTQKYHGSISGDRVFSGPQKFHSVTVPRIGGLSIGLGIFVATITSYQNNPQGIDRALLLICAIPVFGIGLTEDLTKIISVRIRLFFTASGALLVCLFLNSQIHSLDIPIIDQLLAIPTISIAFTVFTITGLSNAYNIIDGFNGLCSMVGMLTLIALGYMGFKFNDPIIFFSSFTMVSAILGFFLLNYPKGLIFLGDGGAYLIGFWVSVLSVLLVNRHSEISPWFALLVNAYPVIETLFSIYRRKFHQGKSPGHPDGMHFHSLIFRRILNSKSIKSKFDLLDANARTSPYLWVMSALAIAPATLFFYSSSLLIAFMTIFVILYVWLYKKIVKFQTPQWLHWLK